MNAVDLVEAVRGAVFTTLASAHEDAGTPVLDHVGQDQPWPFVALDELTWENTGSKDEPLLRVSIDVETFYRGEDRAELLAIMNRNMVLEDGAIAPPGVSMQPDGLTGGGASGIPNDGVSYWGTQTFDFYVEAA